MIPAYEKGFWHDLFFTLILEIIIAAAWLMVIWSQR